MSQQLCVPAIGTVLILAEPWYFRLYFESRNSGLINALTGSEFGWASFHGGWDWVGGKRKWRKPDYQDKKLGDYKVQLDDFGIPKDEAEQDAMELASTWRNHQPMCYIDVEFPAKTLLTVDRIYIRKGVDAYNSLTFWVKKPPKLKKAKKGEPPVVPTDEYLFQQKVGGNRFCAKLPDVNKIVCEVV